MQETWNPDAMKKLLTHQSRHVGLPIGLPIQKTPIPRKMKTQKNHRNTVRLLTIAFLCLFMTQLVAQEGPQFPINNFDGRMAGYQLINSSQGGFGGSLGSSDRFGAAAAHMGDLNGDGLHEVYVGAPGDDRNGTNRGAVWVLNLSSTGMVQRELLISQGNGGFSGSLSNNNAFGTALTSIGDLNGDGVKDIAVGAPGDADGGTIGTGAVWILFLKSDGSVLSSQKISATQGSFGGPLGAGSSFGGALAFLGDINHDGKPELAIGAPTDNDGGTKRGVFWIVSLNTNGTVSSEWKFSYAQGSFPGVVSNNDYFGLALARVGDLDKDGIPELAVGMPRDDDGGTNRGAVWIVYFDVQEELRVSKQVKISDSFTSFTGTLDNSDLLGAAVGGDVDLNNDGVPDLLIGAPGDDDGGTNQGAAWVLYLNSDGTIKELNKISDKDGEFGTDLKNEDRLGTTINILKGFPETSNTSYVLGGNFAVTGVEGSVYVVFAEPEVPAYSILDEDLNWIHSTRYGTGSSKSAEDIQYFDYLGRPMQNQMHNFSTGKVLATQPIYDAYGYPAIQTLAAPVGTDIQYDHDFVRNSVGDRYDYEDFDLNITYYNPGSVGQSVANTLGHHYSSNGEAGVATTSYPFIRTSFSWDPTREQDRTTNPGDQYKMGSGHEKKVRHTISGNELQALYGANTHYKVKVVETNTGGVKERLTLDEVNLPGGVIAWKTIETNEDGQTFISYTADGKLLASCASGLGGNCNIPAKKNISVGTTNSASIHISNGNNGDLALPLPTYYDGATRKEETMNASDILYTITDLDNNKALVAGVDYGIGEERDVTFSGAYATGDHLLLIGIAFSSSFDSHVLTTGSEYPNEIAITYKLDYSEWTLNYYDFAGRLRRTISTKGVDCSGTANHTMGTTFDYNELGQLIARRSPDAGKKEYLYDTEGKLRFTQNEEQRSDNQFVYINHDEYGRNVEDGLFQSVSGQVYFQNHYQTPTVSSSVFTILDQEDGLNDTYCSEKDYTIYGSLQSSDEISSSYTYKSSYPATNLMFRVSRTYDSNLSTWYSYNQHGQVTYKVQQFLDADYTTSLPQVNDQVKTLDLEYDQVGRLSREIYQANVSSEFLEHQIHYDADNRLQLVTVNDDQGQVGKARYEYFLTGDLKRVELDDDLQGLDYLYTVQGRLKSINHPSLKTGNDPGEDGLTGGAHPGFEPDLFGMMIDYHAQDYERTGSNVDPNALASGGYYNGRVQRVRWKNSSSNTISRSGLSDVTLYTQGSNVHELSNTFSYDGLNRLTSSTFGVYDNGTNLVTNRPEFKVDGSGNAINYDKNGNITSLYRRAYDDGTGNTMMDQLTYSYTTATNQLSTIADAASPAVNLNDFNTPSGTATINYNANGEMQKNVTEGVESISYYASGLVKKVVFTLSGSETDNRYALYFYDQGGNRSKTKYTNPNTGKSLMTWYANGISGKVKAIYKKDELLSSPTVDLIQRSVYGHKRIGVLDEATDVLNYEISDQLGNVRVTFSRQSGSLVVNSWADYYPFGSVMPGRNFNNNSYRYGYQGQEKAVNSSWDNFELRMYNSSLGRFTTTDPYNQFFSPYLAMANNPISVIDPTGGLAGGISVTVDGNVYEYNEETDDFRRGTENGVEILNFSDLFRSSGGLHGGAGFAGSGYSAGGGEVSRMGGGSGRGRGTGSSASSGGSSGGGGAAAASKASSIRAANIAAMLEKRENAKKAAAEAAAKKKAEEEAAKAAKAAEEFRAPENGTMEKMEMRPIGEITQGGAQGDMGGQPISHGIILGAIDDGAGGVMISATFDMDLIGLQSLVIADDMAVVLPLRDGEAAWNWLNLGGVGPMPSAVRPGYVYISVPNIPNGMGYLGYYYVAARGAVLSTNNIRFDSGPDLGWDPAVPRHGFQRP